MLEEIKRQFVCRVGLGRKLFGVRQAGPDFLIYAVGVRGWQGAVEFVHSFPGCMSVDRTTDGGSLTQAEVKCRSLVDLSVSPNAPSVLSDDALHRGEPHASAFKFLVVVKPLKHSKKLIAVFRVESCAVVSNKKHQLALDC